MSAPVTTFNEQYSDPAATATGWEETRKALEVAELFWLSTVRADGRPHVTPVVAAWAEGAIWFSTGANEVKFGSPRGWAWRSRCGTRSAARSSAGTEKDSRTRSRANGFRCRCGSCT